MKFFIIIIMSLVSAIPLWAQEYTNGPENSFTDTSKLIIISPVIGETIDSTEKKLYYLFPFYSSKDFHSAQFFQKPDNSIFLKTQLKDGSSKIIPYTNSDFIATKNIIEVGNLSIEKERQKQESKKVDQQIKQEIYNSKTPVFNQLYIELLGALGYYSLNYERVISINNNSSFTVRIGGSISQNITETGYRVQAVQTGYLWGSQSGYATVPYIRGSYTQIPAMVSMNVFFNKLGKNHFEMGLGYRHNFIYNVKGNPEYTGFKGIRGPSLLIAYRYQKPKTSLFFRAGLYAVIRSSGIMPWPGLGLGTAF